jgi:hypothetical protein
MMQNPVATGSSIEEISAHILRSRWFLGVASAPLIGLLILASWPWWSNRFTLKITTRIVEISASAAARHEINVTLPKNAEIQIIGADSDGLPPELASLRGNAISTRLVASTAGLQSIVLPSGGGLVVRATSDGGVDIGVLNDASIVLSFSGTIERVDQNEQHTKIAGIERTTIWEIRPFTKNSPARVGLHPGTTPISLYNQPISEVRFASPRPADADARVFQSEILQGKLEILDTATKADLEPGELVLLEGGSRMLSRLEVVDKAVAVDVSGEANRISVGPPRLGTLLRLDRDLTPSVLSYLLGQHQLKIFWSIAVGIIVGLWKARQWALKWVK